MEKKILENPSLFLKEKALHLVSSTLREAGIRNLEGLIAKSGGKHADVSVLVFNLFKKGVVRPDEIARLFRNIQPPPPFKAVVAAGGYINFTVDHVSYGERVLESILTLGEKYGFTEAKTRERIIVEHTSANPIHPLHVGHLRNSILGDSLARLLAARGHEVKRHFYIDDTGLQVAYAAYGYRVVKHLLRGKPDHFIGDVYAITNLLIELEKLKKEAEKAEGEELASINDKIAGIAAKLQEYAEKRGEVLRELVREIKGRAEEVEEEIRRINRAYERGEKWAVPLVREMVEKGLEGFKETLGPLGIEFDSWDWESELTVWNGAAHDVVEKLARLGLVERKDGALIFRADLLAEDKEARRAAGIPPGFQVAPMTLVRSDGTTLYTTRDIAYSIWKLSRAERVINVIAIQQSLAQAQLRLALYALGFKDIGRRLIHYAYELVKLPGRKMSGRRGEYVAADDIVSEAVARARAEIEKRKIGSPEDAWKIGVGALKFFFLNVSPQKPITFKWSRVLDFEQNSGPFVQYAYVRARGILRKAQEAGISPRLYSREIGEEERSLIMMLGEYPERVATAADQLRPDIVTAYLNRLATEFNKYYDTTPVLKASTPEKSALRLALVSAVAIVIKNGLNILGITPPERM